MSGLTHAIEILPGPATGTVSVPASKSYTNRALLLAALANGDSVVRNPLRSDDAEAMTEALRALGVRISDLGDRMIVHGQGGFAEPQGAIDCRDSGTTIRFLAAACALCDFPVTLTGSLQLQRRPLGPLLEALRSLGVDAVSREAADCPPVTICGPLQPRSVRVDAAKSSQYASALLMAMGAASPDGATVTVDNVVSRPYIDMTLDSMEAFGVRCAPGRTGDVSFRFIPSEGYRPADCEVEFDASAAGHIMALVAVAGGDVTIAPAVGDTRQPDFRLAQVLGRMGCLVRVRDGAVLISRHGPLLGAGTLDMRDWPDMVSVVAVVAAFAEGRTTITDVAHARLHETDRLAATVTELRKMGVNVMERPDGLTVYGGRPRGAAIDSYGDHRMAMAFAAAGAAVPGVVIRDPGCVRKTYPGFWRDISALGICWREVAEG